MSDASGGDGGVGVTEELLQGSLFGFPGACSNYQEPTAAAAAAAAAAPSQIHPPLPRRRRKSHHSPPQDIPILSPISSHLHKKSHSFPVFRSFSMHLNITSLQSPPLDSNSDIYQQQRQRQRQQQQQQRQRQQQQQQRQQQQQQQNQKQEEEIVELPIANQTRRSKSLRELFQADVRMPQPSRFPLSPTALFSSAKHLSFDADESSPISEPAMARTASSRRMTLLQLFNSDGEYSPPSGRARIKLKRRGRLPWKMKIQTLMAKSQQDQAKSQQDQAKSQQDQAKSQQDQAKSQQDQAQSQQDQAKSQQDQAQSVESNVKQASEELQTEAFSEAAASRTDTEDESKFQRAAMKEADNSEKPQLPKLQRLSFHCRAISKDGGWGKADVNPPAAAHLPESSSSFVRTGSIRATLARQVSTSSAHEQYYISRKTARVRSQKRTNLPYREQLISFFCCAPEQRHLAMWRQQLKKACCRNKSLEGSTRRSQHESNQPPCAVELLGANSVLLTSFFSATACASLQHSKPSIHQIICTKHIQKSPMDAEDPNILQHKKESHFQ